MGNLSVAKNAECTQYAKLPKISKAKDTLKYVGGERNPYPVPAFLISPRRIYICVKIRNLVFLLFPTIVVEPILRSDLCAFDDLAWNNAWSESVYVGDSLGGLYSVWGVDNDEVLETIPAIVAIFFSMSMYVNGIFNRNKIKDGLLFIKRDCNYYMTGPENTIIRFYEDQGRKMIFYYVSYLYATVFVYLLVPTTPMLLDLILPSNSSHEKAFLFALNYGVDKQQYFFYICLHSYMGTFMVCNLIASCGSSYILFTEHAYALLAIISYKLKIIHILNNSELVDTKNAELLEVDENIKLLPEDQRKIFNKLLACIKEHQNAIRYSDHVDSLFTKSILAQLTLNVLLFCFVGVEAMTKLGDMYNIMRFGSFMIAQAFHMLFLCFPGQRLLNHGEQVYTTACEVMWYILPRQCHSLYNLLLIRSLAPNKITAYKMAPMTLETFLSIMQAAMSYFTVLWSTM